MNDDPRRDDPTFDETARRVQDAVTAHGRSVQPDGDGSLPVIRHRVASARRRRLVGATALGVAAALVIGVAIGVAAGGDDTTTVAVGDGGSTTTTDPCPPPTTSGPSTSAPTTFTTTTASQTSTASIPTTSTTTTTSAPDRADAGGPSTVTTVPSNAPLTAVPETTIPPPGSSEEVIHEAEEIGACVDGPTTTEPPTTTAAPSTPSVPSTPADAVPVVFPTGLPVPPGEEPPDYARDPVATARAFLQSVGVDNPSLSEYDPQSGQIIYGLPSAGQQDLDLVRSVLTMIERNDHTWAVREARSPSIVIDSHRVLETADGRFLDLYGEGRGYEGTIVAWAEGTGDVAGTARAFTTASGGPELLPFVLSLDLRGVPRAPVLRVVLTNESGEDGSAVDVTAFIVGSG